MGAVEQWYIHTPALAAAKEYRKDCPGAMVRMG
jgi:hypothetical protein